MRYLKNILCPAALVMLRCAPALRKSFDMWRPAQVLLEDGPTTYSLGDLRDATRLAQKIVQSYGMTDLGITMHAPKQHALGFMKRAFEVRRWSYLGFWVPVVVYEIRAVA